VRSIELSAEAFAFRASTIAFTAGDTAAGLADAGLIVGACATLTVVVGAGAAGLAAATGAGAGFDAGVDEGFATEVAAGVETVGVTAALTDGVEEEVAAGLEDEELGVGAAVVCAGAAEVIVAGFETAGAGCTGCAATGAGFALGALVAAGGLA